MAEARIDWTPPTLQVYMEEQGITQIMMAGEGTLNSPGTVPVCAVVAEGAVLFADLPAFSSFADEAGDVEATVWANHFFAWSEQSANYFYGGIVDKFIGDALMIVFLRERTAGQPLKAALLTAKGMLRHDVWSFQPRIGIASGAIAVAALGTRRQFSATAMGRTVNLAWRCASQFEDGQRSIMRVAVQDHDRDLIRNIFHENCWDVRQLETFLPKNMSSTPCTDVAYTGSWTACAADPARLHDIVTLGRSKGVVINARESATESRTDGSRI